MLRLNRNIFKQGQRINWRYAIGEFVLIVVGILVALWINEWAQERNDRALETQYLQALHEELKADTAYYMSTYRSNEHRLASAYKVMQLLNHEVSPPVDTARLMEAMFAALGMNTGYRDPNVWKELQATGNLRLLRNRELVKNLFDFYNMREDNKKNTNDYFEPVIRTNRERVDEIFPIETFEDLSRHDLKSLPPLQAFVDFINYPDTRKNWKKLIVRSTLLNSRIKILSSRAEELLAQIK